MVATSGKYWGGTWHLAPCLLSLMREVDQRWPNRSRISDGSIGDTSHAARKSDHNPDATGDVLAVDITEDHARGPNLAAFWNDLVARRDPRVKYLIYEGRIVASYPTAGLPAWTPRPYTGVNAHKQHLHVSVHDHARHDTSTWFPHATPIEEDDMTPEQEALLRQAATDAAQARLYAKAAYDLAAPNGFRYVMPTTGEPVPQGTPGSAPAGDQWRWTRESVEIDREDDERHTELVDLLQETHPGPDET